MSNEQILGEQIATRIERVRKIIAANSVLSTKLGQGVIPVSKAGMVVHYAKLVVDVALQMHSAGVDACLAPREQVISYTCKALGIDENEIPNRRHVVRHTVALDARARRVQSVLRGSTAKLSEEMMTVMSPKGPVPVSVDAHRIAANVAAEGKDACSLTKEELYQYASKCLGTAVSVLCLKDVAVKKRKSKKAAPASLQKGLKDAAEGRVVALETALTQPAPVPAQPKAQPVKSEPVVTVVNDTPAPEEEIVKESHANRVAFIIRKVPALASKLSGKTQQMVRRGGATVEQPEEAYKIARILTLNKVDVGSVPTKEIIDATYELLGITPEVVVQAPKHYQAEDIPFNQSVYTLLCGALNISDLDKLPGAAERRARLDAIALEYLKTVQPM